ncbi:MAG: protein kinase domain-containing protein [Mycobacteriaceae bacterium]
MRTTVAFSSDPRVGLTLERRYRIDVPIARGGMSTVYRGHDLRLDRPVAIKVMEPQFAADPQFLTRFEREARAVARLKNSALVAVYDQGIDQSLGFLIMELVEGGTLRELLNERGPMPPHAVTAVILPVLDALAEAHQAGLVHRDIKPENILISDSGEVKVADFGLVRAIAAAGITSSSVILGTAGYLSPEQVATGNAGTTSDIYSVGIVLFELLTGKLPFTGDTTLSVAYQRIHNDVPLPSKVIEGIPQQFDNFVLRATSREPQERFIDALHMFQELHRIAEELRLPSFRVPTPKNSAEHQSAQDLRTVHFQAEPVRTKVESQSVFIHQTRVEGKTEAQSEFSVCKSEPDQPETHHQHNHNEQFILQQQKSRRQLIFWLSALLILSALVTAAGWWLGSQLLSNTFMLSVLACPNSTVHLRLSPEHFGNKER